MNSGYPSGLLTLELLRQRAFPAENVRPGEAHYDVQHVRERCNFTTHTPVEAGHDQFAYDLVQRVLGDFIEISVLHGTFCSLSGEIVKSNQIIYINYLVLILNIVSSTS